MDMESKAIHKILDSGILKGTDLKCAIYLHNDTEESIVFECKDGRIISFEYDCGVLQRIDTDTENSMAYYLLSMALADYAEYEGF